MTAFFFSSFLVVIISDTFDACVQDQPWHKSDKMMQTDCSLVYPSLEVGQQHDWDQDL